MVKRSGDVTRLQALVDKKRIVITEEVVHEIMVGKGFSGVETPLFKTMLAVRVVVEDAEAQVPAQGDDVHEDAAEEVATNVVQTTPTSPSPSSPVIPSSPPHQSPCPPQPQDAEGSSHLFQQVLDTCSALAYRVEVLENDKVAQQLEIVKLKARVKKLEKLNKVKSSNLRRLKKVGTSQRVESSDDVENVFNGEDKLLLASTPIPAAKPKTLTITAAPAVSTRRRKGVVIRDPKEELHTDTPTETPTMKDKGKGILIEAPKPMKKKDQVEMDAEYAKKLQEELDKEHEESYKNINWNAALDHVQSKEPHNSPLLGVNTPRSDEDRLKLMELMANSDVAGGFEQIVDFLSGSYINHALTVNPHVYISCIKRFWNTAVVNRSGDVTRLQALVDKTRIVITEDIIREILQLNDAEGVVCLPNDEIFAGLARIGYEKPFTKLTFYKAFFSTQWKFFIHTILHSLSAKRTSWNEFSSAMESALIYLSLGQRFNFSKYIFESLVRNVDSSSKFYMYPRFIQLIIQTNIDDLSKYTNRYISPVLTQKVFANMRRVGKEEVATDVVSPTPTSSLPSSPVIPSTPPHQSPCPPQSQDAEVSSHLFQQVLDTCSALVLRVEGLENANAAQQLEIVKPKARGRISVDMDQDEGIELVVDQEKDAEVEGRYADKQAEIYNIDLDHSSKVLSMQEDDIEVVAASTPIPAAKPKTLKIDVAHVVSTRKRKGVVIRDPEEELHIDTPAETPIVKDKGKGILIEDPKPMKKKDQIDWNAALDHVQSKEPQYIKRYHGIKKKPQSESEARKNIISYLKNTEGYKMEFFKGKTYDDILPIFQARFDANMKFLFKSREEMEKEDEEIIKSINETPAQKAGKRRKLSEEAQEADDLKKRLEIVQDEDDDVFVEATLLA
nr:hypothetical protein [Tanacetum cinerariifolium]